MSDQKVTGNFPTLEQLALSNSASDSRPHSPCWQELRRRFGDVLRPQEELDYIERLLKDY
jgi:hypothetical protein